MHCLVRASACVSFQKVLCEACRSAIVGVLTSSAETAKHMLRGSRWESKRKEPTVKPFSA